MMNRKDVVLTSFGLYLTIGMVVGLFITLPMPRLHLVGYGLLLGFLEWALFYIGYLLPRMRSKLPLLHVWFYVVISGGIFLVPLLVSVGLYNHTL